MIVTTRSLVFLAAISFVGCAANAPVNAADSVASAIGEAAAEPNEADFQRWVAEFKREAIAAGISSQTVNAAFVGVHLNKDVLKRDAYQPEFVKPVWSYLSTAVSDLRVKNGRAKFAENEALIRKIAAEYEVRPHLLTAIWGLETAYGATFGGFNVIEALATLGYTGRRQSFGRQQLMAALKIIDNGDIPADQLQGSWAGAMGHTQFIPTSFMERAVDYDRDGRRDIWGSLGDVFASTANYMSRVGWAVDEGWGGPVILPQGFDWALADSAVKKPVSEWAALGLTPMNGKTLPQSSEPAWILLPAGHRGPAFLVLRNFKAVMRYNNSTAYSLAINMLADRIAGGEKQVFSWPEDVVALTRDQRKEMQSLLTAAGYDTGGVDGIIGANSRKALRAWQRSQGLPADAFPTIELLERLRRK